MPKPNTSVVEAKYSNLTTHHILSATQSAQKQSFIINIEGRTGGVENDCFNYQFFHTEHHPLMALGRAVAKFFYYHPSGCILRCDVKKQIR